MATSMINSPGTSPRVMALLALLGVALLLLPMLIHGQYVLQLINLGLISLIVVVGLNFITGYCGQINFAQAAFWGIGAYVTAILALKGMSFWFALPLAAAVTAAGLVPTLKGAGPFTVFAPTDEAFAKLPAGTVEALLADIPKLTAILTYHVVAGKVMAADVMTMDGKSAATVNGAMIAISTTDGVHLNGASKVVTTDIACTNGVIHIIDTVLMPPSA